MTIKNRITLADFQRQMSPYRDRARRRYFAYSKRPETGKTGKRKKEPKTTEIEETDFVEKTTQSTSTRVPLVVCIKCDVCGLIARALNIALNCAVYARMSVSYTLFCVWRIGLDLLGLDKSRYNSVPPTGEQLWYTTREFGFGGLD